MKFAVLQDTLKEALTIVGRAIDSRPTIPALGNVLIRTVDGRIQVVGSNLEHTISVMVGAKIDRPGAITLPAKTFGELVGKLSPERVDISLNEDTSTVSIRCGKAKSNLKGLHADDYPPVVREPDEWQLELPAEQFKQMIKGVTICAAKDYARPILTGIYMHLDSGCLVMASADGYRLGVMRGEVKSDQAFAHVVPAGALKEFARVVNDDDTVKIAFDDNLAYFESGRLSASVQLLEGKFPDFESLLPRHWNTRATFVREDLIRACKRAEIFARDSNYSVRVLLKPAAANSEPGEVLVVGKSAERGDLEASLDAKVEGDELHAAYNVRFIMDVLNAIPTDEVVFDTESETNPCTFAPTADDTSQQYMIMPMSTNR